MKHFIFKHFGLTLLTVCFLRGVLISCFKNFGLSSDFYNLISFIKEYWKYSSLVKGYYVKTINTQSQVHSQKSTLIHTPIKVLLSPHSHQHLLLCILKS